MLRLRNLIPGLLLAAPLFCAVAVAGEPTISVYKSPTCGCCTQWIGHLEDSGFEVNAMDVTDLGRVKSEAGTTGRIRHTSGHHHLLVDVDILPDMDAPIPRDAQHIHLDGGETEVLLELPPGRHRLQLLLGDEEHEPHAPPLISERISITVQDGEQGGSDQ